MYSVGVSSRYEIRNTKRDNKRFKIRENRKRNLRQGAKIRKVKKGLIMKFEKFLKSVGTHGQIYTRNNGDRWLICGGVGMKIPLGVENLLGSGEVSEKVKNLIEGLIHTDIDDKVALTRAEISADGKASDIIRVFGDNLDIEIGIVNAAFGLLEKGDQNLAEVEVEAEDNEYLNETKFLLILDRDDEVIGFIEGVRNI
jgi:hypothetical protein